MKRICVFAGSNLGTSSQFKENARKLGEVIANSGIELVYGGSCIGLMGELANQVIELGGNVIGVMPTGLFRGEMVHKGLSKLIEVKDMHERKSTMSKLADGYIALPGGFGTFEELFEVISWAQLGIHKKPLGLFNINEYYTPLINMINHAIEAGFVNESHKKLFVIDTNAHNLITRMKEFESPILDNKWEQLSM